MAQLNITLPDLESADLRSRREIRALRDYMYMLSEQLSYALMHLDEENLSEAVVEKIEGAAAASRGLRTEMENGLGTLRSSIEQTAEKIELRVEDELADVRSAIRQNADNIELRVEKGEVVSAINQSAEAVKIAAGKISLEGIVTVNGGFKIHEDGSMQATAGSLGAFSVDRAGNLAGAATLQVGGMTFAGQHASGLLVRADNLDYVYGQPAGSSAAHVLGVSDTGKLCLFDIRLQDGELVITTPGEVPQSESTAVLRITALGDGLRKREYANTGATVLGACSAGEVYGYTMTFADEDGYIWAACSVQYEYDAAEALWKGRDVTPFYIRQTDNAGSGYYFDLTTVNT